MKLIVRGAVLLFCVVGLWGNSAWAITDTTLDAAPLFETNCAGCHPQGGNIIRRGKNLKLKALEKNEMDTPEAIANIITVGKNNMSAFGEKLNADEIAALSQYVLDQANQGWTT